MQKLSKRKYNAIKEYLEKNISFEDYKDCDLWKGIYKRNEFQAGIYVFEREYQHVLNIKKYEKTVNILADYLRGLPSWIDIPFYYNDIESFYEKFGLRKSKHRMYDEYWIIIAFILYEEGIKINVNK